MKIIKRLLIFLSIISAIFFIASFILDIDLVGYFEREFVRDQYIEAQQEENIFNNNFDPEDQNFILYDEDCNKFGPFSFSESKQKLQEGLKSECFLKDTNSKLIVHEKEENIQSSLLTEISNKVYAYSVFEGDDNDNVRIQFAIYQLPEPFRSILLDEVKVINDCHPYGEVLYNRCVYGVFDPLGYGADGRHGNEWEMSIWISDRGLESGNLSDILLHEAAHAYSYLKLKRCMLQDGTSFREVAHKRFGNEENFADAFVHYYGGKWTHYVQRDYLEMHDNKWFTDMIEYCDWYIECKEALEISY